MTNSHSILTPSAPFTHLSVWSAADRGVIVSDRDGQGLAVVLARKGTNAALAQRMREHFHIELPRGPQRTAASGLALACIGPGAWLATDDRRGNALATGLRGTIGDLASISDQSDGYAVLRLEGPKVRAVLEKMLPVDLHPRVFKPGDVAVTVAGHIHTTLWRLENSVDGASAFEVAVFRSMTADFWRVLLDSTAALGPAVTEGRT